MKHMYSDGQTIVKNMMKIKRCDGCVSTKDKEKLEYFQLEEDAKKHNNTLQRCNGFEIGDEVTSKNFGDKDQVFKIDFFVKGHDGIYAYISYETYEKFISLAENVKNIRISN